MSQYLQKENMSAALSFVNGPVWADIKRCLEERKPESPVAIDLPHVAAAKGFIRDAWEKCIAEIEKLPRDLPDSVISPFERPSILDTKD